MPVVPVPFGAAVPPPGSGDLRAIGPIEVLYDHPRLTWTSDPTAHGIRTATISGEAERVKVQQLSELVANPHRWQAISGYTGVLEWIEMDGGLVGPFAGWYLLQSFDIDLEARHAAGGSTGPTPFSLNAAYLPQRFVEAQANLVTVTGTVVAYPETVVAIPPSDLDPSTSQIRVVLGGAEVSREYDPVLEQP